jgi:hypothetical protein
MSNWFPNYRMTETGRALTQIIQRPDRMLEFRLLSNLGMPAVQAIASDVTPIIDSLTTKAERDTASQFCGWAVGQLMRRAGYEVVQERGRVTEAPFKTGAVWQRERGLQIVDAPPPDEGQGQVELGVRRDENGEVIAGWRLVSTSTTTQVFYEIVSKDEPIELAFLAACDYAERYGFPTLWINDRDKLFPDEQRQRILATRPQT